MADMRLPLTQKRQQDQRALVQVALSAQICNVVVHVADLRNLGRGKRHRLVDTVHEARTIVTAPNHHAV